jgi:hypothetical protein
VIAVNSRIILGIYQAVAAECPDAVIINPIANCAYPATVKTFGNLEQYPLSVISGLGERTVVSTRAKVDPRSGPF